MDEPVSPAGGIVPPADPLSQPPALDQTPVSPPPADFSNVPPTPPAPASDPGIPPGLEGVAPPTPTPGAVASESFVVPPAGTTPPAPAASAPAAENPFIPQGVVPDAGVQTVGIPPGSVPTSGNPLVKRLLMIGAFLALIGLLLVGGRFVFGLVAGSKPVTITYWGLWENDTTIKSVIDDFQAKNPKIIVKYVKQSHRQYRERLQAAIARGEGPDLFRFHNTWVPMLRNELMPAPATVMSASEFASTFYPVASADLVGGQSIYGIPLMIDGLGLYINEDLFASAGVTPPTTWEEVLTIVPNLTVKSDDGNVLTSAIALGTTGNVENFSDIIATMMMQNGAKLLEPKGDRAQETLLFYRKFATPSDPAYTWNETMDNSIYAFAVGKVAMIIAPSWRALDIKTISPELRFKIVPVPQLPGNTVTWASYWVEGVSTKSKFKEQSWEFIKYLTSQEAATKLYTEAAKTRLFGEPYARKNMGNALAADPFVGAYIKQAETAKSFPLASRTFDNGINDKLIKYMEDALNGLAQGSAPAAVLETMSAGFRQVLSSYGLVSASAPAAQ